jgi:hypothetical protein
MNLFFFYLKIDLQKRIVNINYENIKLLTFTVIFILIGKVISKFWQVTDRSSWNGGYKIYCKSIFDSSVKLWIHLKNRKVTYVSSN